MKKHHTKNKGDLGVLKTQTALYEQGFLPLLPLTEHSPFDVVAYKDGTFKRIQVRYRKAAKGAIQCKFATSWSDRNGTHVNKTDKSEVDCYSIYCPDTDECYFIDPKQFGECVNLRVKASKNNQKKGVHFASDYRRVP